MYNLEWNTFQARRLPSSGIYRRIVRWVSTDVSEEHRLHLQGRRDNFSKKPASKQVIKAICSSETSVDSQQTTGHYIPKDGTIYNHFCENLKSYISGTFGEHWLSALNCKKFIMEECSTEVIGLVWLKWDVKWEYVLNWRTLNSGYTVHTLIIWH
jgi:hypothetical protein